MHQNELDDLEVGGFLVILFWEVFKAEYQMVLVLTRQPRLASDSREPLSSASKCWDTVVDLHTWQKELRVELDFKLMRLRVMCYMALNT